MTRAVSLLARLLTRIGSTAVLAGLLGGIPWGLLVLVGWPLPREVNLPRTVEDVQNLLSTPLTDQMIVNLLAVVMWLIWASFTASFAGEVIAALRGVPSRRLPVVSPMQRIAGWLLSGVTAGVIAAAAITPTMVAPPAPPAAAAVVDQAPSQPPTVTVSLTTGTSFPQAAQEQQPPVVCAGEHVLHIDGQRWAYLVQHDDSLWTIAELCLGDGARWPDIWELNRGRHFPDVGGSLHDPDLIYPGWDLELPADAVPPPDAALVPDDPEPPAQPEPEPDLEPTPPAPATPSPSNGPDAGAPATPTPTAGTPTPAPATETPAPSPSTSPGAEPTPTPSGPAAQAPAGEEDPDDQSGLVLPVTAVLATAGLLTALVLARLRHHRGRRQQHRRHGRRLAEPDPAVETATRVAAQPADVTRLDHALRTLADKLHGTGLEDLPDIVAAWLDGGSVHLLLATACPDPPPPFVAGAGDMTWTLPADAVLPEQSGQLAPVPLLATIASQPGGQHLLVDVERAGLLTITGDPDRRADLLRYLAAEAATAEWVDHGEVVVVGVDPDETAQLVALNEERVRAGSLAEATARVQRRAATNTAALADTGAGNAFAGRIHDVAADAWMPHLLVVADPTADLTEVDQTLHGTPRCGVAVIAAAEQPGRWNIHVDAAGQVNVDWLSIEQAYATALPADQLARLAPMLRTARTLLPDDAVFDEPVPAADEPWAEGTDLHGHLLEPDIYDPLYASDELPGGDDLLGTGDPLDDEPADPYEPYEPDEPEPGPVAVPAEPGPPAVADVPDLWPEVHQPPAPATSEIGAPAPAAAPDDPPTDDHHTPQDGTEPGIDPAEGSPAVTNHDLEEEDGVPFQEADTTGPARPAEPAEGADRLHPAFTADGPPAARPAVAAAASRPVRRPADPDLDADLDDWHATTLGHGRPRIGVLGPVEVEAPGEEPEFRKLFFAEIVVFLASRGNRGAAPDQLDEAIWPERRITAGARRTAISKVRNWLGEAGDGQLWLPPGIGGDRIYRLADGYLFDWHLFRRLRARGETRGTAGTPDLCRALELVRGMPLDGADRAYATGRRNPYSWLPASNIPPHHVASAVVDTAHQLVTLSLDGGDTTTARWAVEQAWLADPDKTDDHPWVDLMRINHADGHHSELRTLLAQLIEARGVEVPEELAPATFQAIDELAGDLLRVG